MNCFFRIWKTPSFCCRDPSKNIANLPVSVQAQLRSIARKALDLLEHDVLKMLDDCLSQQGSPKSEERVAIWVCMWQLMLMYRELLIAYKMHLGQMMQDPSSPDEFSKFSPQPKSKSHVLEPNHSKQSALRPTNTSAWLKTFTLCWPSFTIISSARKRASSSRLIGWMVSLPRMFHVKTRI